MIRPLPDTAPEAAAVRARLGHLLDGVLARYADGVYQEEAVQAREDWLERAGRVYDDEESYEARLATFHEWYALSRPLAGGAVPAERYLVDERRRLSPEDAECLRALCRAQWTLWQLLAIAGGQLTLFDLWGGGRFEVVVDRDLPGLEEGDLFDARVAGIAGQVHFTRAFLFHPREALATIEAHLEQARGRGETCETVLFRLAQVRLRCDRYRNIAAWKVYEQILGDGRRGGGR